jgi:hypothetical protein
MHRTCSWAVRRLLNPVPGKGNKRHSAKKRRARGCRLGVSGSETSIPSSRQDAIPNRVDCRSRDRLRYGPCIQHLVRGFRTRHIVANQIVPEANLLLASHSWDHLIIRPPAWVVHQIIRVVHEIFFVRDALVWQNYREHWVPERLLKPD